MNIKVSKLTHVRKLSSEEVEQKCFGKSFEEVEKEIKGSKEEISIQALIKPNGEIVGYESYIR